MCSKLEMVRFRAFSERAQLLERGQRLISW